jgi:hypothetical protein
VVLPTFIVIGAAKAGTTALYWYFAEHPQVFMSRVKETNYFAHGLDPAGRLLYGNPDIHHFPITSLAEYQRLFADSDGALAVGEVSPLYLESPLAAPRIRELLPEVKIICCLRHPVDRAYSDYLMYLRNRSRRFDPARELNAEALWARPDSHWMEIGRYYPQLARYYQVFERSQIHVFPYDDLRRDPVGVTQQLYRFVGVDPDFVPDMKTPHNVGGIPASRFLERLFHSRAIKGAIEPWIPQRTAKWARSLRSRNMRKPPELPPELRRELTSHFRDDLRKTSELIGRTLDHWLEESER